MSKQINTRMGLKYPRDYDIDTILEANPNVVSYLILKLSVIIQMLLLNLLMNTTKIMYHLKRVTVDYTGATDFHST